MDPDHLQNWLDYGHGLLIFLYLASFWLNETGKIWGLRAFPGERMGNGLKFRLLMYADHVWNQNWLDYNNGVLFFANFGFILTYWNRSNLCFQKYKQYRPKCYRESLYAFFQRNNKLRENNID